MRFPTAKRGLGLLAFSVHAFAMTLLATASIAEAQARSRFDLPPQSLADSLRAVGSRANINVLFDPPLVAGHQAPALKGEYTSSQAFTLLLVGTGIRHEFMNDHTVVLAESTATSGSASPETGERKAPRSAKSEKTSFSPSGDSSLASPGEKQGIWHRFRLAQLGQASQQASSSSGKAELDQITLEEIIVTAQKREERLQDVPISITVLTGAQLDRSVVESSTEMLNRVPGVKLTYGSVASSSVSMRGAQAANSTSSITAFYIDSVPYGPSRDGRVMNVDVYDLDRIEVLRGPQGTLHGANALNGVIRILSKDPELDKFELKTRALASNTQDGGQNYRGSVAVNAPLVPGKLAVRAVGDYQDLSGWLDKPTRKDANDAQIKNFRLKVGAQPTEAMSIVASAWLSRNDYGSQSIGRENLTNRSSDLESFLVDANVFGLKIGYDFSQFSLTSSTGYLDYKNHSALTFEPTGTNTLQFTKLDRSAFSEELIFNSTSEGPWRWTLGGMYRDSNDRHRISFDPTRFLFPTNVAQDQEDFSESVAVFGELTRSFFDRKLELTAGLRYFHDDYAFAENISFTGNPATPLVRTDATFDATTPRVVLTWLPSEHLTLYTSYSEGFRSGLTQLPRALASAAAVGVTDLPPLDPDSLKNYEIGSKGDLWGGTVGFDIAVYYIDWQDTQRSLSIPLFGNNVAPFVNALVNANSVSGAGVDFALTLRPMRGLLLGANYSRNDLTYDSDVVSGGLVIIPDEATLGTPRTTYGAFADYAFPLGSFTGRLEGSLDYISEGCEQGFTAARVPFTRCGTAIKGTRASFSVEADARWSATLFAENLGNRNDRYTNNAAANLPDWDTRLRPRTIGLQVEYKY